jgi:hypothetical protein
MSPLRRRMIEDMSMRRLAPKTQKDYIQVIKNWAAFVGRSPDTASFEDNVKTSLAELGPDLVGRLPVVLDEEQSSHRLVPVRGGGKDSLVTTCLRSRHSPAAVGFPTYAVHEN